MTTKRTARVEMWVWILLYGGLLALCLGLAVQDRDAALGWTMIAGGGAAALAGVALIVVRSRMKTDSTRG